MRQLALLGRRHPSEPGYRMTRWGDWGCHACGCWEQPDGTFPHDPSILQEDGTVGPCPFAREAA